jgi:polyphosphate kinase 2 (PPK2 family)
VELRTLFPSADQVGKLTVFNRAQAERVLIELDRLGSRVTTAAERHLLEQIQELARQCRDGVHLYLKFYGD